MADLCGVAQGLMGCLNYVNYVYYSVLLSMRCKCISERNKVGYTLLYLSPLSLYNPSYPAGPSGPSIICDFSFRFKVALNPLYRRFQRQPLTNTVVKLILVTQNIPKILVPKALIFDLCCANHFNPQ